MLLRAPFSTTASIAVPLPETFPKKDEKNRLSHLRHLQSIIENSVTEALQNPGFLITFSVFGRKKHLDVLEGTLDPRFPVSYSEIRHPLSLPTLLRILPRAGADVVGIADLSGMVHRGNTRHVPLQELRLDPPDRERVYAVYEATPPHTRIPELLRRFLPGKEDTPLCITSFSSATHPSAITEYRETLPPTLPPENHFDIILMRQYH